MRNTINVTRDSFDTALREAVSGDEFLCESQALMDDFIDCLEGLRNFTTICDGYKITISKEQ